MTIGLKLRCPPNNLNETTANENFQRARSDQLSMTPRFPTAGSTCASKYGCQIGLSEYTTSAYRPRGHHVVHTISNTEIAATNQIVSATTINGSSTMRSGTANHRCRVSLIGGFESLGKVIDSSIALAECTVARSSGRSAVRCQPCGPGAASR